MTAPVTATLVEGKELLETVVASAVAGVGVTVIFSVAIWGVARFVDLGRGERPVAAAAAATVAALALVCTAAAVVIGIIAMTSK
jgi:cation transporter-like permease